MTGVVVASLATLSPAAIQVLAVLPVTAYGVWLLLEACHDG